MLENPQYETSMARIGASLIDSCIFIPISYADEYICKYFVSVDFQNKAIIFFWVAFINVLYLGYSIYLHHKYGQTFGKMFCNIRVVDISETRGITIKQAILRDIIYVIFAILSLSYLAYQLSEVNILSPQLFGYTEGSEIDILNDILLMWAFIDIIPIFFNAKKRSLHDFIAGSVVIRSEYIQTKS